MERYKWSGKVTERDFAVFRQVVLSQLGYIDLRDKYGLSIVFKDGFIQAVTESLDAFTINHDNLYGSMTLHKPVSAVLDECECDSSSDWLESLEKAFMFVTQHGVLNPEFPEIQLEDSALYQLDADDRVVCCWRFNGVKGLSMKHKGRGEVEFGIAFTQKTSVTYNYNSTDAYVKCMEICSDNHTVSGAYDTEWLLRKLREHTTTDTMLLAEAIRIADLAADGSRVSLKKMCQICEKDLGW